MNILINANNSINCVSDDEFTVEYHSGLTLVEVAGEASSVFPGGIDEWSNYFVDPQTGGFLTFDQYAEKYPEQFAGGASE
jgi:hypothetical protein